ncbi:transcription intermediary factor 1-alpha-like [Patella vulgata]|uniref:transcription intermediary factor 1-alpha-like n=1 Tax=Patella vulgata TaxID=6465 RepID=UPI0024A96DAF|nr:transcription intermediary factor 1-alpha-like [Patella vulgata]
MAQNRMAESDYQILRRNYSYLLENLQAKNITAHLFQYGVIDHDDLEEINLKEENKGRKAGVEILIRKLRWCAGDSFNLFIKSLEVNGYHEVVQTLKTDDKLGETQAETTRKTLPLEQDKQYCRKHKNEEIEVYCMDCNQPCCVVCRQVCHNNHKLTDLHEAEENWKGQFLKLKTESDKKIKQLQEHSDYLKAKISDLNNSCQTACDNVDNNVKNICDQVTVLGSGIKDDIIKVKNDEIMELNNFIQEAGRMTSKMKDWWDYSDRMLLQSSLITCLDKHSLADVQAKTNHDISSYVQTPVIRHPFYDMVKIDVESLKQQMNKMTIMDSPTFTSSFNVNQILETDVYYQVGDVMIQGMPWYVIVKRLTDTQTLGVHLWLRKVEDKTVKAVTVDYTFKLLNINNVSKHIVYRDTGTSYKPGDPGWGWDRFIDWDTLINPDNGYLDDSGMFTLQTTVKINKIDRN